MAIFQPSDFSPIHKATERPTMLGWYCTGHITSEWRVAMCHKDVRPNDEDFAYYDGVSWRLTPTDVPYPCQDFPWFGLKAPT